MAFQDLDELLGTRHKQLPIRGKLHTFPDRISAKSGTLLLRITQQAKAGGTTSAADGTKIAAQVMDEKTFEAVQSEVLGKAPDDFIADGFSGDEVAHIFKTLMVWHLYGQDTAERAWADVGPTEPAPPANRAARRATTKAPSKARATSNRSRASHAG